MPDTTSHVFVEITGVAGSGKSTITSILSKGPFTLAPFISARDPNQLTHFVRSAPRLIPLLAENFRRRPRMTWADYKLMVYVTTWDRRLRMLSPAGRLLLDQGPLYALVRLRAKGIGVASSPAFHRWWSDMLDKWLDVISVIVVLDADDDVLMERVNERPKGHDLKGAPIGEGREFLHRYRTLFDEISSQVERRGEPALHRLDTGRLTQDEVARAVAGFVEDRTGHAP